MNALISFRKETDKPPVFTFRRSDGTLTWCKLSTLPIEHDLAHYAVETTLHFRHAFYGLLDQGFTADQFETPRAKRPQALLPVNLPLEALQTEHIVGLLQTELLCGQNPDFITVVKQALTLKGLTYPIQLTSDQLNSIRATFARLVSEWQALASGQQLDLPFTLTP